MTYLNIFAGVSAIFLGAFIIYVADSNDQSLPAWRHWVLVMGAGLQMLIALEAWKSADAAWPFLVQACVGPVLAIFALSILRNPQWHREVAE